MYWTGSLPKWVYLHEIAVSASFTWLHFELRLLKGLFMVQKQERRVTSRTVHFLLLHCSQAVIIRVTYTTPQFQQWWGVYRSLVMHIMYVGVWINYHSLPRAGARKWRWQITTAIEDDQIDACDWPYGSVQAIVKQLAQSMFHCLALSVASREITLMSPGWRGTVWEHGLWKWTTESLLVGALSPVNHRGLHQG